MGKKLAFTGIFILYFIYLNYIGLFNRYCYIGKIEYTTGPDYWIISGSNAL